MKESVEALQMLVEKVSNPGGQTQMDEKEICEKRTSERSEEKSFG